MGCIPDSTTEERSAPRYYSRTRQASLLTVLVIMAVAYVDFLGFTSEGDRFRAVVQDLGGRTSGSLGGWPMGEEHCVTLDRPLTDDEVARLAETMAQCRRRHFGINLRGWDITDARLDEIRETLFARSKGWASLGTRRSAAESQSTSAPESGTP